MNERTALRRGSPFVTLAALLALLGAAAAGAQAQRAAGSTVLRESFAEGNALYEAGDFDGAIERYSRLLDAGVASGDLYYNLANAYYKTGDFGRSVLFYERARRLAPRDDDVRENLALVRLQLRDKQFVREQNRIVAAAAWLHNNLNTREMLVLASSCYLLLCVLGIVFVFRDSARVSAAYGRLSLVSPGRLAGLTKSQDLLAALVVVLLLSLSTGVSACEKTKREKERRSAVVLGEEVPVFSGPTEDTTLQFKVHEGTVLRVREERRGWARIELPGGLSGWVPGAAVERI